jgi:major outer membrane protein
MRRIYLLGMLLSFQSAVSALYMGNPGEPEIIDTGFFISQCSPVSVKIGYEGDWVFDRKLHAKGRIDRFKIQMNQGMVALNYLDRFELYGTVGAMSSSFWNRPKSDGKRREFETDDHWTAGGGVRLLLAQWGNTGIGVDGKIQYGRPGIKWITVNGVSHDSGAHLAYHEWQGSFAVFHTIDIFTPYLGAKYSNVHVHVSRLSSSVYPHHNLKMTSRCRFGMALGCTLSQGKKIDLNAEVQLIDEQAVTISGNIKF